MNSLGGTENTWTCFQMLGITEWKMPLKDVEKITAYNQNNRRVQQGNNGISFPLNIITLLY